MSHLEDTPCDICGAVGFDDCSVPCEQCQTVRHYYCMQEFRIPIPDSPENWLCENCLPRTDKPFQSVIGGHVPVASTPKTKDQPAVATNCTPSLKTSEKLVSLRKEMAVTTGKVKYIPSDEAMKLSSSTKNMKCGSPFKLPSCHVSAIKTTTAPPGFSVRKVKEVADFRSINHSKLSVPSSAKFSSVTGQLPCERSKELKEPMAVIKPAKENDTPNQLKIDKDVKSTKPKSIDFSYATASRSISDAKLKRSRLDVEKSCVLDILPKLEKYVPNYPNSSPAWCGSFQVLNHIFQDGFFDGFRAHLPGIVHRRVLEFSKTLPEMLMLRPLRSYDVCQEIFQDQYDIKDIGLYFFPKDSERFNKQYLFLLGIVESQGLVLRSCIDGMELLIFPSTKLHPDFREDHVGLKLESFLWGLCRPSKASLSQVLHCSGPLQERGESSHHFKASH